MFSLHKIVLMSSYLAAISALPTTTPSLSAGLTLTPPPSQPIPPSQDPFYKAPSGYKHATPGTILRIRTAPGNLTSAVGNASAAYNILYRTTDSKYDPSWAVTTLLIPASTTGHALLSYQIPYNSPDVDSSPSYSLYATTQNVSAATVPNDIGPALGRGWYVNVPDFEGPLASFGLGVQEGHAVLDSVRAVLSAGLGLQSNAHYALWGYSGGSLASEWAAELQVQYAPELSFSGAALGGLVTNVTRVLEVVNEAYFAGLIPSGFLGITTQYPAAYKYLVGELKTTGPYNATGFLATKNMSIEKAFVTFAFQDVFAYFKNGVAVLQSPLIQMILDTNGYMGYHGVPEMPLFVYKAIQDEVTPIDDTDVLIARYCGVGANILYERNTVGGHLAEETNGDARAFEWLSSVFDGTRGKLYGAQGCTIRNVTLNVTSSPL